MQMNNLPTPGYLAAALLATAIVTVVWYLASFTKKHKELPSNENGGARKLIVVAILALIGAISPMFYYFNYVDSLRDKAIARFNAGEVFYCKESISSPKLRRVSKADGFIYDDQRGAFVHTNDSTAYLPGMGGENCR
jgi:hypothetical protein